MAVSFFSTEVSDICLGKPALRSLSTSATVGDALIALKRSEETFLSVWNCDHSSPSKIDFDDCVCIGKVSMVDIVCYLSNEKNISRQSSALKSPLSVLLPNVSGLVRHVDPHSSLLDVIDLIILEGAQHLVIPIKKNSRKKLQQKLSFGSLHNGHQFCWITQEDVIRFLLSSIGLFSPLPAFSIESLGIINTNTLALNYNESLSPDTISSSLTQQTSIAVVDDEGKLFGEISPLALANCDETVAVAITTLCAGDLMAYIECCGPPPEDILRVVKERLHERGLNGMLKLLETSLLSLGMSDDESSNTNSTTLSKSEKYNRSGSYSARMARSAEAIVCNPRSSLVAVMIQAIAHRVNYVWVIEDDYSLAGMVTFADILKVFREHFQSIWSSSGSNNVEESKSEVNSFVQVLGIL